MQQEMRVALNDGKWSRLRHALLAGVDPDFTSARYYCSQPLLFAFRTKRIDPGYATALKLLLDAGANPNELWPRRCYRGMPGAPGVARSTPLTLAAATGDVESARLLLHAGADVARRDE
jgi:ankyrin repeat protein